MTKNAPHFNRITLGLLAFFFLLPGVSQAAVFFNEVAWMGNSTSANHEWIELYNDGAATVVDGWTLTDGRSLSIELEGTIPANAYAVLERTSDESAPGAAFFIYTGALHNGGGSLRLETATGQLVDLVTGGEDWEQIGGDNTTKETAQYTQKGWITAAATPGQKNKTAPTVTDDKLTEAEKGKEDTTAEDKPTQTSGANSSSKSTQTVRLVLPDVTLALEIDAQSVGYVNQTIPFISSASGIGQTMIDSLQYQWNFGDGITAPTAEVKHTFAFPGTYVVTLHAQYKRQKQVTRHEITILPVALSLTQNTQGDIQLNNDSPYEVDISGYTVQAKEAFVFPKYSIILPNQTITLPRQKIADTHPAMVAVYDTHKVQLTSLLPVVTKRQQLAQATNAALLVSKQTNAAPAAAAANTSPETQAQAPSTLTAAPQAPAPAPILTPSPTTQATDPKPINPAAENQPPQQPPSTEAPPTTPTRQQRLSYVGLAIIILLAIFAIYLTPRRSHQ